MTDKVKPRLARLEKEVQRLTEMVDSLTRLVEDRLDGADENVLTDLEGNRYPGRST